MKRILIFIKKIIPRSIFKKLQPGYHYVLNYFAALIYGFPSEKLIVIGVTGTTGKTTVVYMIAQILQNAGIKVGYTSTAMFKDGEQEWLNDKKMTMVGRFFTQKMLRTMVRNKCTVAIVETTSEGSVQYRHKFINYDLFVFAGLYPEHIESHGGFENYKNAKLSLFKHLEQSKTKQQSVILNLFQDFGLDTNNQKNEIPKTIIINGDDEHTEDFLDFQVPQKIIFTKDKNTCHFCAGRNLEEPSSQKVKCLSYNYQETNQGGVKMIFDEKNIQLQLLGDFTTTNIAAALSVASALGINDNVAIKGVQSIKSIPGRLEKIHNTIGATIIVDYAFEPVALGKLYETIIPLQPQKIVHVFGAAGGGRDEGRRSVTGKLVGEKADIVIITNEDPYDDDPLKIIEMVASGVKESGKMDDKNLYIIEDRRSAIKKAIELLDGGDLLLITGKGSEQAIAGPNGTLIPWDDRRIVRAILNKQ